MIIRGRNATMQTSILFLCTGNSCRSQMAEGWGRRLLGGKLEVFSAGLARHGINPRAIQVMAEVGVDISDQRSKTLDELPRRSFDYVITLCGDAHERCPYFPGRVIHRGFDDPPRLAADTSTEEAALVHYRRVRDEIRDYIKTLPDELTKL